jgi:hypothetical protein
MQLMERLQSKVSRRVWSLVRRNYPSAHHVFRSMDDSTDRFSQFVSLCLQSAEQAWGWQRALDDGYCNPDTFAREQDKHFRNGARQRNKALHHIQEDMSRFAEHWSLGLSEAAAVLAQQGWTIRIERTSGGSTASAPDGC